MSLAYDLFGQAPPPLREPSSGEYCDRAGAEVLKARIEAYWRERGEEVEIELVQANFSMALRSARVDLRSKLRNGLPPKRAEQADGTSKTVEA